MRVVVKSGVSDLSAGFALFVYELEVILLAVNRLFD